MDNQQNDDSYFCYIKIHSQAELIIQSVLMGLSIFLVGDAFRKYYRMRGSHNNHVTFLYRLLFFWWITYILSNSYSLIVYSLHQGDKDTFNTQKMSFLSKYYFFTDWVNAYTLQWALLYLPLQWTKQISILFDPSVADKSSEIEFVEQTKYRGFETRINKVLHRYMQFRFVYLVLPVLFLSLSGQGIGILYKIMILSLLVDCVFITYSLVFGMISLKTTEQLKEQLDEQQSKRTFNQYLVVIIANTIRFAIDLFSMIENVIQEEIINADCPPKYDQNQSATGSIADLIVTCLLTFYLPVFIILRIYNLEDRPEKMCESLIISKTNEETESYLTK